MYENNKNIGWKKKENSSNGSNYDDSLIKNQINVLDKKIDDKQDELISGSNIKTINGQSILGNGNITINEGENVNLNDYVTKDELSNKADVDIVPTKVSDLENDSNFVASNTVLRIEVVSELPEVEENGVLYIVK